MSRCILEKEVRGTRVEVDMQKLGAEPHDVAVVAGLDNMDLPLGADSSVDNRVRQQLNSQRVLEN